jgi:hypothetical protein
MRRIGAAATTFGRSAVHSTGATSAAVTTPPATSDGPTCHHAAAVYTAIPGPNTIGPYG